MVGGTFGEGDGRISEEEGVMEPIGCGDAKGEEKEMLLGMLECGGGIALEKGEMGRKCKGETNQW
jgi:hypothetical protein